MRTGRLRGFTIAELVVVLVVLVVIGVFVVPALTNNEGRARAWQTTCLSQVRQMATACQMYSQDHRGHFPDAGTWVNDLSTYLGSNAKLFHCPADKSHDAESPVSYGYGGLLAHADGSGVLSDEITSPAEVGVICDGTPVKDYPAGGLVYGGALQSMDGVAVTPVARHANGTIVGFADGHAKYVPNGVNARDTANEITRAFCMAGALGLVDNPAGGISDFVLFGTRPDAVTIGGEPCTRPLLQAAAAIWRQRAKAPIVLGGFNGQYTTAGRGKCYLWGLGDGQPPAGPSVALARDVVVVIVAKQTEIPQTYLHETMDYAALRKAFSTGAAKEALQVYTFDAHSGTRRFFTACLAENGTPMTIGKGAQLAKDDYDMVDKVACDPHGIGYCSSAIADPERVTILAVQAQDGRTYHYPNDDPKTPTLLPDQPASPFTRTLYAACGGNTWHYNNDGIANVMLAPNAEGTKALQAGPLFKASYFLP